ncbi:ATP-binding cassette domain-containing protein [Tuwongella immobilis]|uniref:ABC transporter domain-containing protein n=1 Tax=Tuwongella immobilis TaxID=692036 RepID=A0A6C2YIP0_9BACT|nr:ATP-binding cassette domain-containing protein [Tuwongella immobilis]VIP01119.1 abc transporter atp-binding type : Uncharacterized protein OS=Candidatus Entotheonella sp. TSY1 GN=ETSY1_12475 PE=4 SV=1: ABC_tran: cNMP_binding [Tuwongella immobilis]VTR97663.1 abc transporter atp-binding type : Uncharacterized protein OS=Candidatus Entotheonella sp. TSY1 GN=ETSY1_12475 PE=4 SV=1: ABC_tran: cNMP_binding [Tuwongella immobilis]
MTDFSSHDHQQPTISIRGLKHVYGSGETATTVLHDIELDIFPGEIVMLLGASGCGKTTLLTLVGGLRSVQTGSVNVLGQEMLGLSGGALVAARRRLGFIFQAHNLFESLTAAQNVCMGLEVHPNMPADRYQKAVEILTALDLGHRVNYKPDGLSGGQKQRVAIARALINKPKLILADEPTAALDEKSSDKVIHMLKRLAVEDGATSLVVTHDTRIRDMADRIITMEKGRIASNVPVRESLKLCEYLRECAVFSTLTPDAISRVAGNMRLERYPVGTTIFHQGDAGDKFYIVWSGEVSILISQGGGPANEVARLGEGRYFGERALMTGEPRNATVRANSPVEVYSLGNAEFQAALQSSTPFIEQIRRIYSQT